MEKRSPDQRLAVAFLDAQYAYRFFDPEKELVIVRAIRQTKEIKERETRPYST